MKYPAIVGLMLLAACGKDVTAPVDIRQCDYVKTAIWVADQRALPVPDTLMQSSTWNLPAPWWLGLNTTRFVAEADGCRVSHQ